MGDLTTPLPFRSTLVFVLVDSIDSFLSILNFNFPVGPCFWWCSPAAEVTTEVFDPGLAFPTTVVAELLVCAVCAWDVPLTLVVLVVALFVPEPDAVWLCSPLRELELVVAAVFGSSSNP